ncbi:malate dehydrogenase [Candidatus Nitrosopumilus sediminis]|uniref:Lactate/malate dehydrogenase n=1 Tax=Candidatus Nitrosopumilus sediminis TaxID=1229909 RepID=K0BDU2_9ARCH|nr:lactate dehydrogenase [Candidatus Nitrosopumilus sediminis]AFS82496.1 lactate/malate dehydrogenase [Candidatus Nitrosopumilus sediminis]
MISIIGSGRVGTSIAFLCVSHALDDVLLVNRTEDKAIGESLDVSNAIPNTSHFSIHGTSDYSKITGSAIVVITASMGVYLKDRTENMKPQIDMIKEIAQKVRQYCPDAIVLVVSNPLDILTYFFQKEINFSRFKVFGIASSLDTNRFRYLVSEKFSVPQSSIGDALVLGEHGDSMVPIFSRTKVDGKPLLSLIDEKEKSAITTSVRNYWKNLRHYKSRSQFGIAKNTFDVINSIVNDQEVSVPVSVVLEGEYGEVDVAMGVPVLINHSGISKILTVNLDNSEIVLLKKSSQRIRDQINSV